MKHPTKPLAPMKASLRETDDRSRFRGDPA